MMVRKYNFVNYSALQASPSSSPAAPPATSAAPSPLPPPPTTCRMQHYPYLQEMKERLLLAPADSPTPPEPVGMEKEHDQVMDTVIKLNPDGFGSHTSPTHAVLYRPKHRGPVSGPPRVPPKNAKTSLFIVMSFIYAKLLVVVCIAFQISEVVTHNVPLHYYEVFFTYLYGASILYLLYVFCYLLTGNGRPERRPPPKKKKKQKEEKEQATQAQKNKSGFFQQESYPRKKKHQNRPHTPRVVSSPIPVTPSNTVSLTATSIGVDERQNEGKDVEGGGVQSGTGTGGTTPLQEKLTGSSHELVQRPRKRKTSENAHGHGSFFLRVGAIAFGLGTMIHNGLELGSWFEIPETSQCYQILRGVNPIMQMVFTFMQMYFIFMNSRLNIHRFKVISRFGLMHVVATNICVWIRTLVLESLKEVSAWRMRRGEEGVSEDYMILEGQRLMSLRKSSSPDMASWFNFIPFLTSFTTSDAEGTTFSPEITTTTTMATTTSYFMDPESVQGNVSMEVAMHPSNYSCGRINIMGSIVQDSAPYLYPFIIEYSLIGAAVIYVMWSRIGWNPKYISCDDEEEGLMAPVAMVPMRRASYNGRVDCVGASKGLFFGLLLLVGSLICLILFFVLIQHKDLGLLAIYLADVSHCVVLSLALLAIFIGFIRVQGLKFQTDVQNDLNDILLRVSAFGLFIYAVFSVIAGSLSAFTDEPNLLVMITGILVVCEVVLQLLFIADVSRRRVHLPEHERSKPGRQVVTFLLICNITMWVIYTFETQKVDANPVQLEFYGFLTWAIVQRVTLPLCIFHRFHSAVAFAEIWKTSYKPRLE